MRIHDFEDAEALAAACAGFIAELSKQAISKRSIFNIALSGGSTSNGTYAQLTKARYSNQLDWQHIHIFWSDERCLPTTDPQSNYRSASEALLNHVPLPSANIHRMQGELDPAEAAAAVNRELGAHFEEQLPIFDLILLGLGDDGHTASLFPGSDALNSKELITENYLSKVKAWRLTFTFRLINAARQVMFLVAGEGKAQAVAEVIEGQNPHLPASRVLPVSGELDWFLDAAAASKLRQQMLGD